MCEAAYLERMTAALQLVESKNRSLPETCARSQNPLVFFERCDNCVHIFQLGYHGDGDLLPEASGEFLDLVNSLDECLATRIKRLTPDFRNCYFLEYFAFLGPELEAAREVWMAGLRETPENIQSTGDCTRRSSLSVQVPEHCSSEWSGRTILDPASLPERASPRSPSLSLRRPSLSGRPDLESSTQVATDKSHWSASMCTGRLSLWCLGKHNRHRNSSP